MMTTLFRVLLWKPRSQELYHLPQCEEEEEEEEEMGGRGGGGVEDLEWT